ncbi:MAG TPA: hypothetical protein DCP51_05855 [Clostridiales bacterium]|nr:hypothetical protein [Clostridiales bacterium]HCT85378.1 hypothetical protein [Candidatus Margulisiibacteriota bacterium]
MTKNILYVYGDIPIKDTLATWKAEDCYKEYMNSYSDLIKYNYDNGYNLDFPGEGTLYSDNIKKCLEHFNCNPSEEIGDYAQKLKLFEFLIAECEEKRTRFIEQDVIYEIDLITNKIANNEIEFLHMAEFIHRREQKSISKYKCIFLTVQYARSTCDGYSSDVFRVVSTKLWNYNMIKSFNMGLAYICEKNHDYTHRLLKAKTPLVLILQDIGIGLDHEYLDCPKLEDYLVQFFPGVNVRYAKLKDDEYIEISGQNQVINNTLKLKQAVYYDKPSDAVNLAVEVQHGEVAAFYQPQTKRAVLPYEVLAQCEDCNKLLEDIYQMLNNISIESKNIEDKIERPIKLTLTTTKIGDKDISIKNYALIRALIDGPKDRAEIGAWIANNKNKVLKTDQDTSISNCSDMAKKINIKYPELILMSGEQKTGYRINTEKYTVEAV